jgi:hypothetical protein
LKLKDSTKFAAQGSKPTILKKLESSNPKASAAKTAPKSITSTQVPALNLFSASELCGSNVTFFYIFNICYYLKIFKVASSSASQSSMASSHLPDISKAGRKRKQSFSAIVEVCYYELITVKIKFKSLFF